MATKTWPCHPAHPAEAQRSAVAHTVQRLQNQLLHHPRAALRSAASDPPGEAPHPLLNAVRHLFGLAD